MKDITNDIVRYINNQNNELEYFLSNYFVWTLADYWKNIKRYWDIIIIEYKKNENKIIKISVDEKKIPITSLIEDIKNALTHTWEIQVDSNFLFSPLIIKNTFRFKNVFQILPIPEHFPQIEANYIDVSHPFILEYSYPKSIDPFINWFRSDNIYNELSLILNSLFKRGIEIIPNQQKQKRIKRPKDNKLNCEYLRLGYSPEEVDKRIKDDLWFTIVDNYTPFKEINYKDYYSPEPLDLDDYYNMCLPSNILTSLKNYFALEINEKEKFLNSSYRIQVAIEIFDVSISSAYVSLATSIEVFLQNPRERCSECNKPISKENCNTCNQPNWWPTKYFKEFINKYSSSISQKEQNNLYNLRSNLSHGNILLTSDLKHIWRARNVKNDEEMKNFRTLYSIIRLLQNNRLNSNL